MASAPTPNLPLMYNDLMPLNKRDHANWHTRTVETAGWLSQHHAFPLTVEEFPQAQRNYPIIFSAGDNPVPLALMGLNEGVNVYIDGDGKLLEEVYIPAYIRRYPWMLARLDENSDTMSLCFDPTSDMIGEFKEGNPLWDGDEPTENTKNIMNFCESFEGAGQRTKAFMDELQKHDLLMEGEVGIQRNDTPDSAPFVYRGFRMINREKLREIRGDQLRTWNQNGMLPLINAHIFSLDMIRYVFARQTALGKGPGADPANAASA